MSGQLSASGTTRLDVVTTLHRGAPSQPTSIRPHSPIDIINNDVLLKIFNIYRLDMIRDKEEDEDARLERWWHKLAHVSRQWRYLILASPAQLNIHLLCTYGVPVADILAQSPPLLPLAVIYNQYYRKMTAEDEEGALLALSHRHRVRRIALWMPASNLGKLIAGINEEFPILERMRIGSRAQGSTGLAISGTVQAPNLRHFSTASLAFPLLNAAGLINLELIDIPASADFPPAYISNQILLMPRLRILKIHFNSPLPIRDVESQLSNNPIATRPLLHLHLLSFRGVNAYLEDLVAGISAPVLRKLDIQFFNQAVPFNVPRLSQFTDTSENLRFSAVELSCEEDSVTLIADPDWGGPLRVQVMCRRLGWQVSCAVEILDAPLRILSAVDELTLSHVGDNQSAESPNEVDRTQWRDLFRPFSNVKTLCVSTVLVGELSRSLCSEGGEMPLEVLPNLLELQCSGGSSVAEAFGPFIIERETVGHPVSLNSTIDDNDTIYENYTIDDNDTIYENYTIDEVHAKKENYDINEKHATHENCAIHENHPTHENRAIRKDRTKPDFSTFDHFSFVQSMGYIGGGYRTRAMELISECHLFAQAQDQSFQSDIELRMALAAVDNALSCAAVTNWKTTMHADQKMEKATKLLGNYERKYHFRDENPEVYQRRERTLLKRMDEAMSKDKSLSSSTRDDETPTRLVEFLLCQSPTDEHPTVVDQVLDESSNFEEILWNFSRLTGKNRLTLTQNPHFYKHLPTAPEAYGSRFQMDPIWDFRDFRDVERVYVLTDSPDRVYLETPRCTRTFGNVWVQDNALIFKDVCGKLESEDIVGERIESTVEIWCCEEPSSLLALYGISPRPFHMVPSTCIAFSGLWRELVRRKRGDHHLRISTKPPESPDGWTLYSPINTSPSFASLTSPVYITRAF